MDGTVSATFDSLRIADGGLLWILMGILALALFAALAAYLAGRSKTKPDERTRRETGSTSVELRTPENVPKPSKAEKEHQRLTREYCDALCEIETSRAETPFKELFLSYAPIYQTLLALKREDSRAPLSPELFTGEILIAAKNHDVSSALKEGRFLPPYQVPDLEKVRDKAKKNAEKATEQALRVQIDKERGLLEQIRDRLPYRAILTKTQPFLSDIIRDAQRNDRPACLRSIVRVEETLRENGCRILFADDKVVRDSEALEVDFRDNFTLPAALPGLYVFVRGSYALLRGCGGTRRVK